jgi:ABC-2 type transport system permease protein
MSGHRIFALFLRHMYLYKRSLPRLMEIFYWPFLDLLLWGFITLYLGQSRKGLPNFVAFFLGALILWDILFRSQQGISVSFLEDVWARNFLNLFVSPLTPGEYLLSLLLVSSFKIIITSTLISFMAWIFYSFDIFLIGLSLIPFVFSLVLMGWAVGIITTSMILRFGQQAEILAWGIAFLFQPISAVFYPMSVLPGVLRSVARFVPASYVFEGMRDVINTHRIPIRELAWSFGLNAVYLAMSLIVFNRIFRVVKKKGLLVRIGE